MGVQVRELKDSEGCILECTTTGAIFGFVFSADPDVVEDFIQQRDPREIPDDEGLWGAWSAYLDAYKCAKCGEAPKPEWGGLERCKGCAKLHCSRCDYRLDEDESDVREDGDTFGHRCGE